MPLNQIAKACVVGSALPLLVGGGGGGGMRSRDWMPEDKMVVLPNTTLSQEDQSKVIVDYYWMWG